MSKSVTPSTTTPSVRPLPPESKITVRLPFKALPEGTTEMGLHGQLNLHLTQQSRLVPLRALLKGLEASRATLIGGRPVFTPQEAIYWLLENIEFTA